MYISGEIFLLFVIVSSLNVCYSECAALIQFVTLDIGCRRFADGEERDDEVEDCSDERLTITNEHPVDIS